MKRVVLIGNRSTSFFELQDHLNTEIELVRVYAVKGSRLARDVPGEMAPVYQFTGRDKETVIRLLKQEDFDVLVSHGCPFLLPISDLRKSNRRFLNIHPSYLPRLKGKHPANGVLLFEEPFAGATLHEMEDEVDAGRIIHQEQFPITPDIDLPLLYELLFQLEATVFRTGLQKLIDSRFEYAGEEPQGESSYYTRRDEEMQVDFRTMIDDEILRRVRAFGIESQGVIARIDGQPLRIVAADRIVNPTMLKNMRIGHAARRIREYNGNWLIESRDGIIKVTKLGVP